MEGIYSMIKIQLQNIDYELVKDYKNGFDLQELTNRYTDYFIEYDYILGDWAYGKLRLKGFCNENNQKLNDINNYATIDSYIKDNCAYDCKYFIIKKK